MGAAFRRTVWLLDADSQLLQQDEGYGRKGFLGHLTGKQAGFNLGLLAWSGGLWVFTPTGTFEVQYRLGCIGTAGLLVFHNTV